MHILIFFVVSGALTWGHHLVHNHTYANYDKQQARSLVQRYKWHLNEQIEIGHRMERSRGWHPPWRQSRKRICNGLMKYRVVRHTTRHTTAKTIASIVPPWALLSSDSTSATATSPIENFKNDV